MIHELKIAPQHFENISIGKKTFEVRLNDRNYCEGDILVLNEYLSGCDTYTGKVLEKTVVHVHNGLGMLNGFVVLGIV